MFFDVIFFSQHYFLYPGKEELPAADDNDEKALLEGNVQQ